MHWLFPRSLNMQLMASNIGGNFDFPMSGKRGIIALPKPPQPHFAQGFLLSLSNDYLLAALHMGAM